MDLKQIKELEQQEFTKRDKELCLIASENYPDEDILEASGSIFQLKYAEGFPHKRYYQGCEIVDKMEQECIDKCLELFEAQDNYYANVQPNSGASANMIVYNAVLEPQDYVLAMDVQSGAHISHGHPKSFLAKYHNVVTYGVNQNGLIDYEEVEKLAMEYKPKLIICGASNYSPIIYFQKFKEIANKCGAYLMTDIAHISTLVAHGLHPSPIDIADFITFTTHKMLAGSRGGVIIYKKEFDKQIKLSTIPSLFGGPLEHQIYAKLLCFNKMLQPEAKKYSEQILSNMKAIENQFKIAGIPVVSNGTFNHLLTVDLTNFDITGKQLAELLEECGVICNCNSIPNDKRSFLETSGIRIGTPAVTKRGLNKIDCQTLGYHIAYLINCFKLDNHNLISGKKHLKHYVEYLVSRYPLKNIYPKMYDRLFNENKEIN